MLDPRIGRWFSIDPEEDEIPWQTPYCSMDNNPILVNDPEGDFGFIGALVGAVVNSAVETGSQMVSNAIQGKDVTDIDWADVGIAAAEGAVIGATGGASLMVKGVRVGATLASATAQAGIDKSKTKNNNVFTGKGDKSKKQAVIEAGLNLTGGAVAGKVGGKITKSTSKEAVQQAAKKSSSTAKAANKNAHKAIVTGEKKHIQQATSAASKAQGARKNHVAKDMVSKTNIRIKKETVSGAAETSKVAVGAAKNTVNDKFNK